MRAPWDRTRDIVFSGTIAQRRNAVANELPRWLVRASSRSLYQRPYKCYLCTCLSMTTTTNIVRVRVYTASLVR